jgi:hypothetical protein
MAMTALIRLFTFHLFHRVQPMVGAIVRLLTHVAGFVDRSAFKRKFAGMGRAVTRTHRTFRPRSRDAVISACV